MSDQRKILIADDEPDSIEFVREALADSPYEVVSASNGAEAISVARDQKPDLIILDVEMPEKNGFEVFAELRKSADIAKAPVIMLTGVAEKTGIKFNASDMGEFLGGEPDAYIDKPIEPFVLKQTVARLLKQPGV